MLDAFTRAIEQLTKAWHHRAELLDTYGAPDSAKVHRELANELVAMHNRVRAEIARLSVEQYATQHGVTPDTVRRWVRAGQLPATKGSDGSWSIPYGAVRRKLRKVA